MKSTLLLITIVILLGCSEDSIVEHYDTFRKVQFDLQCGFENKFVSIIVDSTNHFGALLSSSVPFAGPQAFFNTTLKEGEHRLVLFVSSLSNSTKSFSDTTVLTIGSSEKYFVGIELNGDSLAIEVQESSFSYF